MILVANDTGSKEFLPLLKQLQVPCELAELDSADFAFEGNGPHGRQFFGIERKTLSEIVAAAEGDGRYNEQRVRMARRYAKSFLIVEGNWKPDFSNGWLMEICRGGWKPYLHLISSARPRLYSSPHNYLLSVAYSGVIITYSKDERHTAFNVAQTFQWHQKAWENHTSLLDFQKMVIPSIEFRPSLTRQWAQCIRGVGDKMGLAAETLFRVPIKLAKANEMDWMRIPGIHPSTAKDIIRQIWGVEK